MIEVWVDIIGYEGKYKVSNKGRIISIKKKPMVMKIQTDRYGYNYIKLTRNGKGIKHKVHRLVASAFIPNTGQLPCINHIDGIKINNTVDNLEWCSVAQNNKHKIQMLYLKEYNGRQQTIPKWAKEVGLSPTTIRTRLKKGFSLEKALTKY